MREDVDKRQRTWLWVSFAAALTVVAAGVLTAAVLVGKKAAPVFESVVAAQRTELVEPGTLSGKPRIVSPVIAERMARMKSQIARDLKGDTSVVAAAYGELGKETIFVIGGSAPILDPAKELDTFEYAQKPGAVGRSTFNPIDAGPLGGQARCGWIGLGEAPMNVCVWADKGSKGAVYWADAEPKGHSAAEFHAVREQIQKR